MAKPESPPPPRFTMSQKAVAVKATVGLTVATMTSVVVSVIAASLALGLLAALPILRQQGAIVAEGGGGAAPIEEEPPEPAFGFQQYLEVASGAWRSLQQATDGGLILAGWAIQTGQSDQDIYLAKASRNDPQQPNTEGSKEWSKFFGQANADEAAFAVIESRGTDGQPNGYAVAGTWSVGDDAKAVLLKTTLNGELDTTWPVNPKLFGATGERLTAYGLDATFNADGTPSGYVMVGRRIFKDTTDNSTKIETFVIQTTLAGELDQSWAQNPVRLQVGNRSIGYSIQQTFSARVPPRQPTGFVVAGNAQGEGGNNDIILVRLRQDGSLDPGWQPNPKTFDFGPSEAAQAVRQTFDGAGNPNGYVVVGHSANPKNANALLLKLNEDGTQDLTWSPNPASYGAEGYDTGNDVRQTFDGAGQPNGFILVGETHSDSLGVQGDGDLWMVRTNIRGLQLWQLTAPGTGFDTGHAVQPLQGSVYGYAVAGQTQSLTVQGSSDAWLILIPPGRQANPPVAMFRRGDSDGNGQVNLTDSIFTLNALFKGGPQPRCKDASDADDNGQINLTDAVFTLNYLFRGSGLPPPPPGPTDRGSDPTQDSLGCEQYGGN